MRIIPALPITLNEIADLIPKNRFEKNAKIRALVTNSKEAEKGDLFVALEGENSSGEYFTEDARARGAYILSSQDDKAEFKVKNTYDALLRIASYYKCKFNELKTTIAITGSVGKTTTKNILTDMLRTYYKVHSTKENFNNALGLAHTIFTMPSDTEILIAEIGMNHRGEIGSLSNALKPDIGIITNIGSAHIGNLGSRKAIAEAKLEISSGMTDGKIVVPHNEDLLSSIPKKYTFSTSHTDADCCVKLTEQTNEYTRFDIKSNKYDLPNNKIKLKGKHILNSVAICISIFEFLGIPQDKIDAAICSIDPESSRGKFMKFGKLTFFDDSYSSSPEAVIANLEALAIYKPSKLCCVLGDMLELGAESERLHKLVGKLVYECGFSKLFTFGRLAEIIAEGAIESGMPPECVFRNPDLTSPEITANQLYEHCDGNEIILCKASHSIQIDRIYTQLRKMT